MVLNDGPFPYPPPRVSSPDIPESPPPSPDVEAILLAGGLSSRMGRDKARIRVAGRSLLAWSTDAARLLGLPVRVIRRDDVPRCGPLGGVATALHRSKAGILLFLSCDMPLVTPALLQRVLARLTRPTQAAFTQAGQHLGFPFALRLATRSTVDALIAGGQCSLRQLAEALDARNIPTPKRDLPLLANINTPDTLDALRPTLLAHAAARRPRPEPDLLSPR